MSKISVILSSYNHAKFIRESIESVLNQTFSDFELIIWDDASTDDSWKIIKGFSDPRIRTYRNLLNQQGGTLRQAIKKSLTRKYIAIHNSDDIWEPDKLEKQVSFLDNNPEFSAVFTKVLLIDENNDFLIDERYSTTNIFDQPNRSRFEWLNFFFYKGNALCHPSVLFRKKCYDDCGPYRLGLAQIPDFDLWVRLCMKYDIYVLPETLVRYRIRQNNLNASGDRPETRIRWRFELLQVLSNYRAITSPEEFKKIFPDISYFFIKNEYDIDYALAMAAFKGNGLNVRNLFGLSILFEILNDPERLTKVKQIYGFNNKKFIALTTKYDVFSTELNSEILKIKNSNLWEFASFSYHFIEKFFPKYSSRRKCVKKMYKILSSPFRKQYLRKKLKEESRIIESSGLFDVDYYMTNNNDVATSSVDPICHYLSFGANEGRDPSSSFKTRYYLLNNPDVRVANVNPLIHYILYGKNEGRNSKPDYR